MANSKFDNYAKPDVLVSTEWLSEHLNDDSVRIVESDEDVLLYDTGHIPNAINIDWQADLNHEVIRDYVDGQGFKELMEKKGISRDHTVVFYGDKNNWWATYAFWVFHLFGHPDLRIMDGGRQKWVDEARQMTKEVPEFPKTEYPQVERNDEEDRAFFMDVMRHISDNGHLIDVRSPDEFTGKLLHMADHPQEGALRGGHIQGAANVPWSEAANDDGTFKEAGELQKIYKKEAELGDEDNVITYCRIGERSSHTWFVLKYLLGYENVRNYDGSWTEWGNLVRAPIER